MELSGYVETVRQGVRQAAALGDENTQQVAQRLGDALDSATRLALISSLSDATSEINAELAPASVELRMNGQDPEFKVTIPSGQSEPTLLRPPQPEPEEPPIEELEGEPVARISLRLPQSVKQQVDEQAAKESLSTNAWLLRAILDALAERRRQPEGWPGRPGNPISQVFGPHGPFGPHGVFGPGGPFGPGGLFGGGRHHEGSGEQNPRNSKGHVQGWVR